MASSRSVHQEETETWVLRWREAYFHWLEAQIKDEGRRTFTDMLTIMHSTEFQDFIPNDDNRLVDGLELRVEFFHECEAHVIAPDMFGSCSVLEVLIAISRRIAFIAGDTAEEWAWRLVENLELDKMYDPLSRRKAQKVVEVLENLIQRRYNPDGSGGFFPLQRPDEDQTQVELWYQMSAYVEEIHPEW